MTDDDGEDEINNTLSDAILKRPESFQNSSFGGLRKNVVNLNED